MFKIRHEDHELLSPGMRVRITPSLRGGDKEPYALRKWTGKEVTVNHVVRYGDEYMVGIEEDDAEFYMEEVECIVDDNEIAESDEPIDILIGGII